MKHTLLNYLQLSKARMIPMVLVIASYGFFLGGNGFNSISKLIFTLLGMALVAAGSAALNNYLEKDVDALMKRTRYRVLPTEKIPHLHALIFGVTTVVLGVLIQCVKVNLLTAFLMLLASFLYVLVYTPLKRLSTWNTFVGAIPGAMPAMAGWTAATGELDFGAWVLFAIIFAWQHPHFYAIAIMYKQDYIAGGYKMLPLDDPNYRKTSFQTIAYSILLILVSVLPSAIGLTGSTYFFGSCFLGVLMLAAGIRLALFKTDLDAVKLFRTSLVYLPALLFFIAVDHSMTKLFTW